MQREKVRVYALARELNVESKDLLDLCKKAGFDVKNQLSNLEPEQRDAVVEMIKKGAHKHTAATAPQAKPVPPNLLDAGGKHVPTLARPKIKEPEPARTAPPPPPVKPVEVPVEPVAPAATIAPVKKPEEPAHVKPVTVPSLPTAVPHLPSRSGEKPAPAAPTKPVEAPVSARAPETRTPETRPAEKRPTVESRPPETRPEPRPTETRPPEVRPAAESKPQEIRPAETRPTSTPPRLPASGPREVVDLGGGSRPSQNRPPRRPPVPTLGPRPVAPPPLKALAPKPKQEEPRQKPIKAIDPKLFQQKGPITLEDVMAKDTPVVADVEVEDDESKGKSKTKQIPGRDTRRAARAERAEKRKKVGEVDARTGKIVTEDDDSQKVKTLKHLRKHHKQPATVPRTGKALIELPITVRSLSEAIGMRSVELLFKLKDHGAGMLNINSVIDPEVAELIALDYGGIEIKKPLSIEEETIKDVPDKPEDLVPRAPVVTIMGHVDHGKTTLLDKIRKSNIAATEAGGITQVIRAWRVEHGGRPITFLDTPGHEAFTKMRARGAQVTDIAVIVVAADDGVMPQTEEAIQHARAAGVSLVIAINKVDMPTANLNKTRQQLYGLNVLPDNMGGDTPFVETSAATGKGIDELLDQLSVVAELKELKANPHKPGRGSVLEARLSEGEGVIATLLVRDGTLRKGDVIVCGAAYGRVRQLYNDMGKQIDEAGPSVPVRIAGLDEVPNADDPFNVLPDLAVAREIANIRKAKQIEAGQVKRVPLSLERLADAKIAELKVILKADFRGSIEAIRKEMEKLAHDEVRIKLLKDGIGAISEADVWLALTSPEDTMIVGFNVVPDSRARVLAEEKGIQIREYNIIYNLTNDIKSALEGKLKPREEVINLGRAIVRKTFKISRVGTIAGCYVTQGVIRRNAKVRLIREGVVIYPPPDRTVGLDSLKRVKDDASEVREGFECGIKIAGYDDVKPGDVIEAYRVEQVQRTLDSGAG